MNILIKLSLSCIILAAAILPHLHSAAQAGSLETVFAMGITGTIILFAVFFIAVAFYCKTLQRCLTLIAPQNRQAAPKSVWYMFLIPFNFIEDFFIIINISNSIQQESKCNDKLAGIKDYGMVTGIGWCIAQLLSFIPGTAGELAGISGVILWVIHWVFILRVNKRLHDNEI